MNWWSYVILIAGVYGFLRHSVDPASSTAQPSEWDEAQESESANASIS